MILLGVDRLDYTKGILRRLLALEHLLRDDPSLRERIRLIQVAVPSRDAVATYQEFGREVDQLVGRINGAYGTATSVPIHYVHQSISQEQLVALYRAADVMLVTPLRDGMNLVAKEYIASRVDDDGVLVLSEFAGAAEELHEAVLVNAYDTRDLADKIHEALDMPTSECTRRMRVLRRRVMAHDVHRWAHEFLGALERDPGSGMRVTAEETLRAVTTQIRASNALALLLDYDGTLVPLAPTPEEAAPDHALPPLLASLAARQHTHVHLVSGRPRATLEAWFAALPITLWAEHGIWVRPAGAATWQAALEIPDSHWIERARALMEKFADETPDAFVEAKGASIAWHYRLAARAFGAAQARELRLALSKALADAPIDIMEGKRVLEVRPRGAGKALVVQWLLSHEPAPALLVAFGDDRTDEELFAALPPGSVSVHVGAGATMATHRLRDWTAARRYLASLVA
jgi:trehalose 6-phosphate synthase/phosphatase